MAEIYVRYVCGLHVVLLYEDVGVNTPLDVIDI